MKKRSKKQKIILAFSIILILIAVPLVYFLFFFSYGCDDFACYKAYQEECVRVSFQNDLPDAIWSYQIKGIRGDSCEAKITLLKIKQGTLEKKNLEGKSMYCELPLGYSGYPESNLKRCTGELKEELQELIIQKLHSYILENLNDIGKELNNIEASPLSK